MDSKVKVQQYHRLAALCYYVDSNLLIFPYNGNNDYLPSIGRLLSFTYTLEPNEFNATATISRGFLHVSLVIFVHDVAVFYLSHLFTTK